MSAFAQAKRNVGRSMSAFARAKHGIDFSMHGIGSTTSHIDFSMLHVDLQQLPLDKRCTEHAHRALSQNPQSGCPGTAF
ncbi:hypothetical protein [Sorangium sp. So ce394]|uniref:hypothetical protein n=1 Tax=Sorangium sp. So ce394 TaxID=3133310 RepID=UPI003F5BF8F0